MSVSCPFVLLRNNFRSNESTEDNRSTSSKEEVFIAYKKSNKQQIIHQFVDYIYLILNILPSAI